jgi:type IV pilus assembly protein PilB
VRKRIGECLIQAGLITEEDLRTALAEHERTGESVGAVLVRLNLATEKQITKALAYQLGFPYISLTEDPPEPAAIILIPKEVALKRLCVAARLDKNRLTVAMSDPLLFNPVQDLELQTGYSVNQAVATRSDILASIEKYYPANACPHCGHQLRRPIPEARETVAPPSGRSLFPSDVRNWEVHSGPRYGSREQPEPF